MCHSEFSWGLNCSGSWPVSRLLDSMTTCRKRKREAHGLSVCLRLGCNTLMHVHTHTHTHTCGFSPHWGLFPRALRRTHMSLWEMQMTSSSESPASLLRTLVGASGFPRSQSQLCAHLACLR